MNIESYAELSGYNDATYFLMLLHPPPQRAWKLA